MEFWKRKKGPSAGGPPSGNGGPINPATISGPIHSLEPSLAFINSNNSNVGSSTAPRSPIQGEFLANNFTDAEFREKYKSYQRTRRLSHSSQRTTNSAEQVAEGLNIMSRPRTNDGDSVPMLSHSPQPSMYSGTRAPSVISNASSTNSGTNTDARSIDRQLSISSNDGARTPGVISPTGPPRGSLRSARSAGSSSTRNGGMTAATAGDSRDSSYSTFSSRSTSLNTARPSTSTRASDEKLPSNSLGRRSGMAISNPGALMQPAVEDENISEEEIDLMLGRLMDEMDLKEAQRMQMQKMSIPNKLKLLKQHRQLESFQMDSKGNAPEYFYRYLTETDIRSLPKQMLVHLRVCVSTQPVNWVKQFVDIHGLEALSECLGILNHAGVRKGDDITKEMEIIRCIKSVVNIQWGAQDVLRFPTCVHNLCFSIDAPSLHTRRLISEILTYICYLNVPTGHATVLKGLDKLQKFREMQKRFEPWMRALETAIDGRGRMGSRVGVSDELRQLGGTADRDLTDYALSSMIFINAVVGVSDDVEMRIHYRNQLNAAGLSRIIKKLRTGFDSPLIALQINKFDKESEQDHADVLELYNQQIMQDMTDPEEVFQAILAQIDDDDRAREHFLSILQRLLLLRDDFITDSGTLSGSNDANNWNSNAKPTKARYYQLLDEITTQVVMDIRNGESLGSDDDSDDDRSTKLRSKPGETFTSQYGVSVAGIIDKFSNEEQLEEAVREAKDLREQLEKVTRQKNELELEVSLKSEGLVGTLKTKIFALEDLLRMSRHTIEALQTQIKELRDQFTQKLAKQDSQLKQLYSALQDEAGEHDMLRQLKDDLTLENEVLRSGIALQVSEDNPDEVVLNHDLLLAEIEKLKKQRPELNRMTKARQMLEEILSEAGQGIPVKTAGKPNRPAAVAGESDASDSLPDGAKRGTVTMQSLSSIPARLPDFAAELQSKLGKRMGADSGDTPADTAAAAAAKTEGSGGDSEAATAAGSGAAAQPPAGSFAAPPPAPPPPPPPPGIVLSSASASAGAAPPPPAPPPPPAVAGSAVPAAPPPMAPPPPPAMGGAAPSPPAPPPPPMTSGSAATSVSATAAALASVKLRSTSKDGDSSSASPPPAAPPAPAPAPPAPPSGAPPPPAPTLLGPLRRKELLYVPKVKLKALQWDKLNDMHVDNSLWSKLEDRSGLEEKHVLDTLHGKGVFEQVERMFAAKQAVDLFALREKRRKERAEQEQEEISVLDPKRAYNINIMLGMLKKYSFRDIRNALIRMDTSIISENMLKQLLTFVPTPEERGLLSAYVGRPDRKRLAKPDRFFLETMKVWRYEQRLRVTIAWATWPESFRDMQQDVAAVMTASHAVATSRHFPQVLEVVLSIGNFMNGSGFRGGAFGFKIASLNRLMDTKADDNKTTLLHFVASTIEDNFEEALEFLDELKPVDAGCRVSYAEMKAEMGEMRMRLREAKRELELLRDQRENELKEIAMAGEKPDEENKAEAAAAAQGGSENEESASETEADGTKLPTSSASDPQDRFLLTIRRFLIEANEQYDALSSQFTAMEDSYSNSVLLYGEDPQALAPEEFFGIFKTFTASFNQVNKDNTRERERKKAAEKRRKQIEAQIEQKRLNKQNRANRLAAAANMLNQREMGSDQDSSSMSSIASGSSVSANGAAQGAGAGGENGAVDDLLKSLMAGTDLERVEATKRRRRRELMSIRRRSSLRRSVHRTSISIKALQMLRDIKEEEDPDANDNDGADGASAIPPLPRSSRSILRAHRNAAREKMSTITEDDMHDTSDAAGSQMEDPEAAELREARRRSRRQLLDD